MPHLQNDASRHGEDDRIGGGVGEEEAAAGDAVSDQLHRALREEDALRSDDAAHRSIRKAVELGHGLVLGRARAVTPGAVAGVRACAPRPRREPRCVPQPELHPPYPEERGEDGARDGGSVDGKARGQVKREELVHRVPCGAQERGKASISGRCGPAGPGHAARVRQSWCCAKTTESAQPMMMTPVHPSIPRVTRSPWMRGANITFATRVREAMGATMDWAAREE